MATLIIPATKKKMSSFAVNVLMTRRVTLINFFWSSSNVRFTEINTKQWLQMKLCVRFTGLIKSYSKPFND